MPIGNQVNLSMNQLNIDIGEVAVNFHSSARAAIDFFERVNSIGVAGLANLGFDNTVVRPNGKTDAQNFFDTANQMNTAGLVWFGTIGTAAFNFDDATAIVR